MKKDLLILCIVAVILVFIITGTKIQSVDDYYLTHLDEKTDDSETVFLSIECRTLLELTNWNYLDDNLKKHVPEDGVILGLRDGDGNAVFDENGDIAGIEYVLRSKDTSFNILKGCKGINLRRSKDTVFDILDRAVRHNKIKMVHQDAPFNVYNSVYVQEINYLGEFDGGELSGWVYSVNGAFPNYGCSAYIPKNGDRIEWKYTCDLGRDVGMDMGEWQK